MEGLACLRHKPQHYRGCAVGASLNGASPPCFNCPPCPQSGGLLAGKRWAAGGGGGYLGPSQQTPGTHRFCAEGSLLHSWHCRGAASSPAL